MWQRRGPIKLASITYEHIASWAGLTVGTVRGYASRGQFNPRDIESVLSWCNGRRAAQGLPLIGAPAEKKEEISQVDTYASETRGVSRSGVRRFVAPPSQGRQGGYNPLTGSYEG